MVHDPALRVWASALRDRETVALPPGPPAVVGFRAHVAAAPVDVPHRLLRYGVGFSLNGGPGDPHAFTIAHNVIVKEKQGRGSGLES